MGCAAPPAIPIAIAISIIIVVVVVVVIFFLCLLLISFAVIIVNNFLSERTSNPIGSSTSALLQ
jgi:hypothetical protein